MTELYPAEMIGLLEALWGDGFLSPGGVAEVGRVVGDCPIRGKTVLDIGCGAGGIDLALAAGHGAAYVTGIDVEDGVLARARALVEARGLGDRIGLVKVAAGPLPFPPETFEVVFSKDAIVHIHDKAALMAEAFRVLKPGGWFLASDWLIANEVPSPQMAAYIAAEGLDFGMATTETYQAAMSDAGFEAIKSVSRNPWYRREARDELARLTGPMGGRLAATLGREFIDHNIAIWQRMIPVLDSGEHCPTHLSATKP